ncbi:MAG: hypothetical protein WKG52_11155 [Variovorax sp.]
MPDIAPYDRLSVFAVILGLRVIVACQWQARHFNSAKKLSMNTSSLRMLPAVLAMALVSLGFPAMAQTQPATTPMTAQPTATERARETGSNAVNTTKRTTKKATTATKRTARKAGTATKNVAQKTGGAIANAGHKTADAMRSAGHKIGEKVPGTAEHAAAKKQ